MIKGIMLFSINVPHLANTDDSKADLEKDPETIPKWKKLGQYIPSSEDSPKNETIDEIMIRYYTTESAPTLNIRLYPLKYFVFPINAERSLLLIYILDAKESLEIVQIYPEQTIQAIEESMQNSNELKVQLEKLFTNRNKILEKLENAQVLQEDIGSSANKLIDANKFDEAQDLIKLAKTIPEKMNTSYLKSKQEGRMKNYRQARKYLSDCLNYAQKIEDLDLQKYLEKKIDVYTKIPQYEKDLKSLVSSFSKELGKTIDLPSYQRQVYKLDKALDLLDKLEEDELIEKMLELSNTLILAGKLVFDLKSLDRKIKTMISEFSF